jgi:hypothetical protein
MFLSWVKTAGGIRPHHGDRYTSQGRSEMSETLPRRVSLLAAIIKKAVAEARRTPSRRSLLTALDELDRVADALTTAAKAAQDPLDQGPSDGPH